MSHQPGAGIQPPTEEEPVVGDAHLARQTLPHGQAVGLLPRGEADGQEPPGLLPRDDEPLPPAGVLPAGFSLTLV